MKKPKKLIPQVSETNGINPFREIKTYF